MPQEPVAYFITFTTYGTWLQGRDPGWVDRQHNQYGAPIPQAPKPILNENLHTALSCDKLNIDWTNRIVRSS